MFGINYLKAGPTQYVLHYQSGKLVHSGVGLAFFYYRPAANITIVPVGSADAPFIFNEMTADFQPVTVQGQLTYRVANPQLVASLLNFTVGDNINQYTSDDPEKLAQRIINLAQVLTRAEIQNLPLREALKNSEAIVASVTTNLSKGEALQALGVEVLTFTILAIKTTPEIARALEAEARETLLRQADQAIYDRRNASVEQERRIKENELNTEIAVEEKKRQIRETKAEADLVLETKNQQLRESQLAGQIKLEEERRQFVAAQTENARAQADVQAYAIEAALKPLQQLDPALLQVLALQSTDPRLMVSLAMKEIAQNAAKIGQLNISPDLLEGLLQKK